jgi:hypothetical protein
LFRQLFHSERFVNTKKKKKKKTQEKRNTKTDGTADKKLHMNRTYGTTAVELFKKRIPTSE